MLHVSRRSQALPALTLLVAALALLVVAASPCRAQTHPDKAKEEPPFHEYKGVRIGMTTEEARKLLGNPTDKDDKQDLYSFNDNESCQVYYDATKKVFAISVSFLGGKSIPAAKSVLGDEADAKQDGSIYKLIRFPKAGYWVSYTRTSGDAPMTIIAMQKIQ
ncbi:MAG: hypothetical protein QOJ70_2028 [Acidobacteriota bacterium]|jgi:hypothetical protein|nr:hypothetical protein [Acidobacteriota bacterium]